MTVEELQKHGQELKHAIYEAIIKYKKETGGLIPNVIIEFDHQKSLMNGFHHTAIKVDVSVEIET